MGTCDYTRCAVPRYFGRITGHSSITGLGKSSRPLVQNRRILRAARTEVTSWGNIFFPGVHLYSGQLDRAEEKIRIATQLVPKDPLVASWEALLWAKRGETGKAEQAARRTLSHHRVLTYSHHAYHAVAAAFAVIGKPARALSVLKKAAGTGLPNYPLFRDDPHFASLRNHPEFLRFLAGLKREWEFYKREFGHPKFR